MTEKYKGYIISTSWNGKTTGFDFRVRGENGTSRNCAVYGSLSFLFNTAGFPVHPRDAVKTDEHS